MLRKILTLVLLSVPVAAYSAETDHYTVPESEVVDITAELNEYSNAAVAEILAKINAQGGCGEGAREIYRDEDGNSYGYSKNDEERLYEGLGEIFEIHGKSRLVDDLLAGKMPRTVIPLKESVYGEWSVSNGYLLGRTGAGESPLALAPLIKVGGLVIGTDKLEHMFGLGYDYFKRHYMKGMSLKKVLKIGVAAEKTYLGGNILATGVFTYADLSANFNGMRFWNHMLQKEDDLLGKEHNYGPYIVCEGGKWKQNPARPIDLSRYVDKTFQENLNCSKFASQGGVDKFNASLARLRAKHGDSRSFSCPTSKSELEEAAAKYMVSMKDGGTIDHWIINREGNAAVSYFNEF